LPVSETKAIGTQVYFAALNNKIDIRNLSAGSYLLIINYKEGFSTTKKIIKK